MSDRRREGGFGEEGVDAGGNVGGREHADTNGGKYNGCFKGGQNRGARSLSRDYGAKGPCGFRGLSPYVRVSKIYVHPHTGFLRDSPRVSDGNRGVFPF